MVATKLLSNSPIDDALSTSMKANIHNICYNNQLHVQALRSYEILRLTMLNNLLAFHEKYRTLAHSTVHYTIHLQHPYA